MRNSANVRIPRGFFNSYKNIPQTDIRQELIEVNKTSAVRFYEGILEGSVATTVRGFVGIDALIDPDVIHVTKELIHKNYIAWMEGRRDKVTGFDWFFRHLKAGNIPMTETRPHIDGKRPYCLALPKQAGNAFIVSPGGK